MTEMTRLTAPFPKAAGALLVLALGLAGCGGGGLEQARAMPPEQIAAQSDEYVCDRLKVFGYTADVPVTWLREAQRRKLESCIDQGMQRRSSEDARRDLFPACSRFGVGPMGRCW